jgi:hypothetical protein
MMKGIDIIQEKTTVGNERRYLSLWREKYKEKPQAKEKRFENG